ncbi:hypothetical protein C482_14109 [Natrialba chahannaoensis JCM 10990]|uniref:Halobacterial output domain-containing protein n=1 Tax=Natrialba chahannaoensis JCM 10990 TaxID=1227492 RepID=M0AEV3_9EURY|nr:HalOD1 output domain-containing protein [Natrialba chahannaoensis]ELY97039.1 hypothetical protein C482_14109 [Natrialba chahannaoensis JCM 10990]
MSSPDDTSPPGTGIERAVSPSQAIIEAVAAREGVDPTDIEPPAYEPLYSVVNPEALDSLFRDAVEGSNSNPNSNPQSHSHSQETQADAPAESPSESETGTRTRTGTGTGTGTLGHVELEYEGYLITVYSDGQIELEDSATPDGSVDTVDE